MRNTIFLVIICSGFMSCDKPTQIQIVNDRADEKITNFGIGDYYSDTGRIRNVEHIYIEYGEITDIWIGGFKTNAETGIGYDLVDEIVVSKVAANSSSNVIEIENCTRVEISYFINAYNHYYRNSEKIATEKIKFEKGEVYDNIKYGETNKLTIK